MKLNHSASLALIFIMGLTLSACSTTHKGDATAMNGNAGAAAQSYGYNDQSAFDANSQKHVNSLQAPSNQVYYFSFNSSQFNPSDLQALKIQASYIATHPSAQIRLEGNTDARGSREYNVALGWRRAQAVKSLLRQRGVEASQIEVVSYGKERPVAFGNNEQAWALNRRVNLIYESK